jgi:hypothetical protein
MKAVSSEQMLPVVHVAELPSDEIAERWLVEQLWCANSGHLDSGENARAQKETDLLPHRRRGVLGLHIDFSSYLLKKRFQRLLEIQGRVDERPQQQETFAVLKQTGCPISIKADEDRRAKFHGQKDAYFRRGPPTKLVITVEISREAGQQ